MLLNQPSPSLSIPGNKFKIVGTASSIEIIISPNELTAPDKNPNTKSREYVHQLEFDFLSSSALFAAK